MSVYLLHFDPDFKHAGHYIGYCNDNEPDKRLATHLAGKGSRLVKAAVAAGCEVRVAHFIKGASRTFERTLKNRGSARRWCPVCGVNARPLPVYLEAA